VELDRRIADLRRMRRAISGLLALPCIDPAARCPIIKSSPSTPSARATSAPRRPLGAAAATDDVPRVVIRKRLVES
jgi:hypothetical protein